MFVHGRRLVYRDDAFETAASWVSRGTEISKRKQYASESNAKVWLAIWVAPVPCLKTSVENHKRRILAVTGMSPGQDPHFGPICLFL